MLSVVIPTHDRWEMLIRLLDALAAQQDVPDAFEVIVVADGCSDGTAAHIQDRHWSFSVRVIEQPQRGQAAARNHGARVAQGDVLVFFDDDMVPQPDFLAHIASAFSSGADGVVGRIRLGDWVPDTLLSREFGVWTDGAEQERDSLTFDEVLFCAGAVRRELFERAGGFDEAFTRAGGYGNEDIELGHRLLQHGARLVHQPHAVAATEPVLEPGLVLQRQRAIGRSDVLLLRKHPELIEGVIHRKTRTSRKHRWSLRALGSYPALIAVSAPARWLAIGAIRLGARSRWLLRIWSWMRAMEYWRGVRDVDDHRHVIRSDDKR